MKKDKKILNQILVLFISTGLIFSSCIKNVEQPVCISSGEVPVQNVTGPNATNVNANIDLTISFQAMNGCGNFDSFKEATLGDTTFVATIAKYIGCVCTQDLPTRTGIYKFKKSAPGQYFLKFNKGNSFLVHQVTVQ